MITFRMPFGQFAIVQPPVLLERGAAYPFIAMEDVEPRRLAVNPGSARVWDGGGGARFENGDVLFARITPCLEHGKTVQVLNLQSGPGFGSTEFFVFRGRESVSDSRYIYYLACSELLREPAIKSMVGASGRQRAQRSVVEETLVPAPSLPIQRRIAAYLSAYDDLIENNRRRMVLLEEAARLLYHEWFVRLKFPGHERVRIKKGLPDGWRRMPLPEAIEVNPRTPLSDADEHWYVEMADLASNSMIIQNAVMRDGRGGSKFRNGDTLLARITPCLENGKTGYVNFMAEDESGRGSTEFIVLRSKCLTPEYVYCLARDYDFRENAIKSMIGASGRQRVQESCFDKFEVCLPPALVLDLFADSTKPIFTQIHNLHAQNQKLRAARDLLLPRLMSGEIAL